MNRLKSKNIYKYFLILLALAFSFLSVGFSSWNIYDSFSIEAIQVEPVCYNSSTGVQYYTIEDALKNASSGQTIYCYIGKNPTIRKSCEVKTGVTLSLPFDDAGTWNGRQSGTDTTKWFDDGGSDFADCNATYVNKYRKNSVKIATNVTLTNKGTIDIGGVLGTENIGISGHTSGNYCEFVLSDNATIKNTGTIHCLGYIKEESLNNGSKLLVNSGTVYAPFIIYDYRGGSSTAGSYKKGGITPFNVYDMPNIKVYSKYTYSSKLIGYADLHTGTVEALGQTILDAQHNTTDINMIGNSSSVITLTNQNSYVEAKYKGKSALYTEKYNNSVYTELKITGGASSGVMKLTVKLPSILGGNTTVSTEGCYFPINYKWRIYLNDGTYKFINPMKIMNGAEVYVSQNATLNVTSNLIVYPNGFTDVGYGGYAYPSGLAGGKLYVNGQITYSGGIGGLSLTESLKTDFSYIYEDTSTTTISSSEGYATRDVLSFVYNETNNITETASAYIYNNGTIEETNLEQTVYISESNADYFVKASNLGNYTINYYLEGGTIDGETGDVITKSYPILKGQSLTLNSFSLSSPFKRFYDFNEWKINSSTGESAIGQVVSDGSTLNLYASYDLATYRINYSLEYKEDSQLTEEFVNDNPIEFTYNDLPLSLNKPTDGSLYFYGWYYNNDTSVKISSLSQSDSFVGYGDIDLSGYFSPNLMATVSFNANGRDDYFVDLASYNLVTNKVSDIKIPESKYDNDLTKEYYVSSWKDQNGVTFSDSYTFSNEVTVFYAQWSTKAKINYWKNYSGSSNNSILASYYYYPGKKGQLRNLDDAVQTKTNYASDESYYDVYQSTCWQVENTDSKYAAESLIDIDSSWANSTINMYPAFDLFAERYYKVTFINKARYINLETKSLSYYYSLDNSTFTKVPDATFSLKWGGISMDSEGTTSDYFAKDSILYIKVNESYYSKYKKYYSTLYYPADQPSKGYEERTVSFNVTSACTVTLTNDGN